MTLPEEKTDECKNCGLMRSTVLESKVRCMRGEEHDFGDHFISFPTSPSAAEEEVRMCSKCNTMKHIPNETMCERCRDDWQEREREEWIKADDVTGEVYDINAIKNSIANYWIERIAHHRKQVREEIVEGWKEPNKQAYERGRKAGIIEDRKGLRRKLETIPYIRDMHVAKYRMQVLDILLEE